MPLARKSKIFGLHSILANTTPVPLKTRLLSGFSLTRCFSDAPVAGKTECGFSPHKKLNYRFIDRLARKYMEYFRVFVLNKELGYKVYYYAENHSGSCGQSGGERCPFKAAGFFFYREQRCRAGPVHKREYDKADRG